MKSVPIDETVGRAAAVELYELLAIAVAATRTAKWRPGDSLEALLAPAVVAIAAEVGKAVQPHADHIRDQTIREIAAPADSVHPHCPIGCSLHTHRRESHCATCDDSFGRPLSDSLSAKSERRTGGPR